LRAGVPGVVVATGAGVVAAPDFGAVAGAFLFAGVAAACGAAADLPATPATAVPAVTTPVGFALARALVVVADPGSHDDRHRYPFASAGASLQNPRDRIISRRGRGPQKKGKQRRKYKDTPHERPTPAQTSRSS